MSKQTLASEFSPILIAMPLQVFLGGVSIAAQRDCPTSVFCQRSSMQFASVCSVGSPAGALAPRRASGTQGISRNKMEAKQRLVSGPQWWIGPLLIEALREWSLVGMPRHA